jgi:hypothetical protein
VPDSIYGLPFYAPYRLQSYDTAGVIVPLLQELLLINSVCDVGCGDGAWLRAFHEAGVADIYGCDSAHTIPELSADRFLIHDLNEPFQLDRTFDLAVSSGVAQYLPENRAATFVEDLTKLSRAVLFSSAIPGQSSGGAYHLNERWPSYWAKLFALNGYDVYDVLRPEIWHNRRCLFWVRQNLLLFVHPEAVTFSLRRAMSVRAPLDVVHPEQLAKASEVDLATALHLLWGALERGLRKPHRLRWRLEQAPAVRSKNPS